MGQTPTINRNPPTTINIPSMSMQITMTATKCTLEMIYQPTRYRKDILQPIDEKATISIFTLTTDGIIKSYSILFYTHINELFAHTYIHII